MPHQAATFVDEEGDRERTGIASCLRGFVVQIFGCGYAAP
jgi:hypothetical protein